MYFGFKEGFASGAFIAFLLRLGLLTITIKRDVTIILFVLGLFVDFYQAFYRKSLFNPPIDGFVSGFGAMVGLLDFFIHIT